MFDSVQPGQELVFDSESAVDFWVLLAPKRYANLIENRSSDLPQFGYKKASNRYCNRRTTKRVPLKYIRELLDSVIEKSTKKGEILFRNFEKRAIALADFQHSAMNFLADNARMFFLYGLGGVAELNEENIQEFNKSFSVVIKNFYRFLEDMERGYASLIRGKPMTMSHSLSTFSWLRLIRSTVQFWHLGHHISSVNAGKDFGFRLLGVGEGCPECMQYATEGVKPVKELIPPGQKCRCKENCSCRMMYYRSLQEAKRQQAILCSDLYKCRKKKVFARKESSQFRLTS